MSDGLVSYVLAGCAFDAPCETVAKSLAERFGGAIGPAWVKSSTIKDKTVEDKMGFILSVGGIDVLVIYEDFPVPAETFTGAVTYAVLSGSDEVEQRRLVDHRAHAIVAAMGSHAEHESSVRAATSVLRVCSVLSELSQSTAVFWTEFANIDGGGRVSRFSRENRARTGASPVRNFDARVSVPNSRGGWLGAEHWDRGCRISSLHRSKYRIRAQTAFIRGHGE